MTNSEFKQISRLIQQNRFEL